MSHEHDPNASHDIGCLEAIEGLYAWLDGELETAGSIEAIEAHISECQSCYSRAEVEQLLNRRLRAMADERPEEEAPQALRKRLDSLLKNF